MMDSDQNQEQPQQPDTQTDPHDVAPNPKPHASYWRKLRWPVIVIAGVVVLSGAVFAAYHLGRNSKTPQTAANTTAKTPTTTNISTQSTNTSTNANVWKASVNPRALPLGDGHVASTPQVGYIDSCTLSFKGGGAQHTGSWVNTAAGTWDSTAKVAVMGTVNWPAAKYSVATSGTNRVVTTNDLPMNYNTGTYPISSSDPAFQYDRNPNSIAAQTITYTLPLNPTAAASPGCTSLGAIGVLSDGVVLYNGLDAAGRDAVAHETQDACSGHPDGRDEYHYHDVPSCIQSAAKGSSTLVGYALDGYGIYVERDANGNLPTNADLDECHGRTSQVMWNGQLTTIYHYDATLEYPYTIGCFHGTSVSSHP